MKCWYLCRLSKGVQKHLKISRARRQELQLVQDQQLLATFDTIYCADCSWWCPEQWQRSVKEERVHLFSFESGFFLGQIWFNIISEPLVNAPLTSIWKKSPCFSSGSVTRHQRIMDFDSSIFSLSTFKSLFSTCKCGKRFFSRLYFFIFPGGDRVQRIVW